MASAVMNDQYLLRIAQGFRFDQLLVQGNLFINDRMPLPADTLANYTFPPGLAWQPMAWFAAGPALNPAGEAFVEDYGLTFQNPTLVTINYFGVCFADFGAPPGHLIAALRFTGAPLTLLPFQTLKIVSEAIFIREV
jgi:hypothetical protein